MENEIKSHKTQTIILMLISCLILFSITVQSSNAQEYICTKQFKEAKQLYQKIDKENKELASTNILKVNDTNELNQLKNILQQYINLKTLIDQWYAQELLYLDLCKPLSIDYRYIRDQITNQYNYLINKNKTDMNQIKERINQVTGDP